MKKAIVIYLDIIFRVFGYSSFYLEYLMVFWSIRKIPSNSSNIILISGCPKSGTSLLHNLLSLHKDIDTEFAEFDFSKSDEHRNLILDKMNFSSQDRFFLIKRPNSNFYLNLIRKKYPNIKVINVIRDGRDVSYSAQRFFNWPIWFAINTWKHNVKIALKLSPNYNLNIKYEDLVKDSINVIRSIESFAGLDHHISEESLTHFYLRINNTRNIAEKNSLTPIFKSSIGKWKSRANSKDMKYFRRINNELKTLGY